MTSHSEDATYDHDFYISDRRGDLLAELSTGITALRQAAVIFTELRSNAIYDVELAEDPQGNDVAAFLNDSGRYARAAYSIIHDIIANERA